MKTLRKFFTASPARFFLAAAIAWGILMALLYHFDKSPFQWHDILNAATGLLFDLLVFGVLLSLYDASRFRNERIERYTEEIEDFRWWKAPEAAHRIAGAVRRLNREGVRDPELFGCYLAGASLRDIKLTEANLLAANLTDTDLTDADLRKAILLTANLSGAKLVNAKLMGADLCHTPDDSHQSERCKPVGGENASADLTAADLTGANLGFALVDHDWFAKIKAWEVIDSEHIEASYIVATDKNGVAYLKPTDADRLTMLDLLKQYQGT